MNQHYYRKKVKESFLIPNEPKDFLTSLKRYLTLNVGYRLRWSGYKGAKKGRQLLCTTTYYYIIAFKKIKYNFVACAFASFVHFFSYEGHRVCFEKKCT